ncbi:MAG: class I SAM-dependent methyltransferase [Actinomycetota bacterium]|nr:class I SAM-dependent methyltransferase [Actinomycetota bacterium]
MHAEAFQFVANAVRGRTFGSVLEIGGRNVNGSISVLFDADSYTTVDIAPGDGVDIVADAAEWVPPATFDCVVCCEVFEHTPRWPEILATMAASLDLGGTAIVTAASLDRAPHSAVDGGPLHDGEFYANVDPADLAREMRAAGFSGQVSIHPRGDVYAVATKTKAMVSA